MLFPPNENGSYFILGEQNPNKLKNFTTAVSERICTEKGSKYSVLECACW
jgi:hypothetical protein